MGLMNLNNLTTFDYCVLWYLAGLLFNFVYVLYDHFFKKSEIEITIEDLFMYSIMSIAGPILWLAPIVYLLLDLSRNYSKIKNKVVWKNRRAKNKDILFGDNDE